MNENDKKSAKLWLHIGKRTNSKLPKKMEVKRKQKEKKKEGKNDSKIRKGRRKVEEMKGIKFYSNEKENGRKR